MKIKVMKRKYLLLCVIAFVFPGALLTAGAPKFSPADLLGLKASKDIQTVYNDLSEIVPAVIYIQPEGTTDVPVKMLNYLSDQLKNQMIKSSLFKPVSMSKYLDTTYGNEQKKTIFQLVNELSIERYPANVKGLLKAKLFKCADQFMLYVSYYPLKGSGYPYTAVRIITSKGEIKKAVKNILEDISNYVSTSRKLSAKYKIAVNPFEISCRTLVEQRTGEFDFIKTTFSSQNGIEMKETDDFLSCLASYQACSTGLYVSTPLSYIGEYVKGKVSAQALSGNADYVINGKLKLSNRMNVLTMELVDTSTGAVVRHCDYFTKDLCFSELWNFNNQFLSEITKILYKQSEYAIVSGIGSKKRGLYKDCMFVGWNTLNDFPVPTGKIIFNDGTMIASTVSINPKFAYSAKNTDYFVYTNGIETRIFTGREGEFVWNLLEK